MERANIKRIAVFCSGGDAPGMNAALRAVVRTAAYHGLHVYAVHRGYEGMIKGEFTRMEIRDVGNIIQRGGTVIRTARSKRFMTPEGRKMAYENLQAFDIDACVAIGGNGTFTGAQVFSQEFDIPFMGIPGTIDNDLYGTDYTIGFDTAVNTAVEAVDKIRDTADSHDRVFFVEVMGRHSGFIALNTAIASGAGSVVIPEVATSLEKLKETLRKSSKRGKLFNLFIVAEGCDVGGATALADIIREDIKDHDPKVTIIGHLQRGGSPTAMDRLLASRLGHSAVEGLLANQRNVMVGVVNDEIVFTPFEEAINFTKVPKEVLMRMAEVLAI